MPRNQVDLLVLGSGSAAFAAALRARELDKTAAMVEERTIGGTCVNRGCLPSKNLIEAARILHESRNPRFPGLRSRGLDVDFTELVAQKDDLVRSYRERKYESLLTGGIEIVSGHGEFVDPHTVDVGGRRISGGHVVIATGARPVVPRIEGLDDVPYLTSDLLTIDEPVELRTCPRSLLVVGGGYIALELGQMFARFGARVTLVERGESLLAGFEPDVGQASREVLASEGVRVLTRAAGAAGRAARAGGAAVVETEAGRSELQAERLLVATGRRANTDRIAIERAGVALGDAGQVRVDEHLRTNVSHVFAVGDVIGHEVGSQMATPAGSQDGGIAAHNALSGEELRSVSHRDIPRAVFTDPQVGTVGRSEAEAIAAGHRCWCNAVPMSLVPRAGAIRDTRGFVKMVADADSDEVLGVTMVGREASEVIHEAAMALRFRATTRNFAELVHVYPTMAEALKIVAISRFKDPAKLSCCAE